MQRLVNFSAINQTNSIRAASTLMPKHDIQKESINSFKASNIEIHERVIKKTKPELDKEFIFGKTFTDHMLSIDWDANSGWGNP